MLDRPRPPRPPRTRGAWIGLSLGALLALAGPASRPAALAETLTLTPEWSVDTGG